MKKTNWQEAKALTSDERRRHPRLPNKFAPNGWMDKYLEKWELLK